MVFFFIFVSLGLALRGNLAVHGLPAHVDKGLEEVDEEVAHQLLVAQLLEQRHHALRLSVRVPTAALAPPIPHAAGLVTVRRTRALTEQAYLGFLVRLMTTPPVGPGAKASANDDVEASGLGGRTRSPSAFPVVLPSDTRKKVSMIDVTVALSDVGLRRV